MKPTNDLEWQTNEKARVELDEVKVPPKRTGGSAWRNLKALVGVTAAYWVLSSVYETSHRSFHGSYGVDPDSSTELESALWSLHIAQAPNWDEKIAKTESLFLCV